MDLLHSSSRSQRQSNDSWKISFFSLKNEAPFLFGFCVVRVFDIDCDGRRALFHHRYSSRSVHRFTSSWMRNIALCFLFEWLFFLLLSKHWFTTCCTVKSSLSWCIYLSISYNTRYNGTLAVVVVVVSSNNSVQGFHFSDPLARLDGIHHRYGLPDKERNKERN